MRSKLILLLLIPLLAYGGAMGYLWYSVKSGADDAIAAAAPFAAITYEGVHISPLGDEVGLDRILISPNMTGDEFRIGQVRVSVPHIGHFLLARINLSDGKPPEKLGMQITGLELDVDSELFDMLEQMQQAGGKAQSVSLDALGCGDLTGFSITDMRRMGLGTTISDISINSAYDDPSRRMLMDISAKSRGLVDLQARVEMQKPSLGMGPTDVPKMQITYRDTGYYDFRNRYCARLNGGTPEQYVDRHVQLLTAALGGRIPEKTVAAYRGVMLKGGTLSVAVDPDGSLPAGGLQNYTPAEIVNMLDPKVAINGTPLDIGQIKWDAAAAAEPAKGEKPQPRKRVPPPRVRQAPAAPPAANTAPVYRTIEVPDASGYLGRMAEITTVGGKVRTGSLAKVEKERLHLKMRLSSGTLTYPVKIDEISKIRIRE